MSKENKINTFFKVDYDSYCEETSEADPDDEYSRASTATSYSVKSISVVSDDSMNCVGAFPVDDNIGNVYVVYAVYSTGDSFGHDEGGGIEFIEVFQSEEKANRCAEQIQAQADLYTAMSNSYINPTKEELKAVMDKVHNCPSLNNKNQISSDKLYPFRT